MNLDKVTPKQVIAFCFVLTLTIFLGLHAIKMMIFSPAKQEAKSKQDSKCKSVLGSDWTFSWSEWGCGDSKGNFVYMDIVEAKLISES